MQAVLFILELFQVLVILANLLALISLKLDIKALGLIVHSSIKIFVI